MGPWPMEKRSRVTDKIKKEAARVAERIGAKHVVIIAFFPEGEYMHMQDAGNPPMDYGKLYHHLATAHAVTAASGGEDIALS